MAYCIQCKAELGIDSKRHADVCMHMQIVYEYMNRFVSMCLESGRAASMHLMGLDPTAVAVAAFEAAVKGARAVATIATLASAGRGSGCSASGRGAQQGKRRAGFTRVAMRVAMAGACARARGGSG